MHVVLKLVIVRPQFGHLKILSFKKPLITSDVINTKYTKSGYRIQLLL